MTDRLHNKLRVQIAERKQQARDRNIKDKAVRVAVALGEGYQSREDRGSVQTDMLYEGRIAALSQILKVRYYDCVPNGSFRRGSLYVEISLDGEQVFSYRNYDIAGYTPGAWEEELDRLYALADKTDAKVASAASEAEAAEERERTAGIRQAWGL